MFLHYITDNAKTIISFLLSNVTNEATPNEWTEWEYLTGFETIMSVLEPPRVQQPLNGQILEIAEKARIHCEFGNLDASLRAVHGGIVDKLRAIGIIPKGQIDDSSCINPQPFRRTFCNTMLQNMIKYGTCQANSAARRTDIFPLLVSMINLDPAWTNGNYSMYLLFNLLIQHAQMIQPTVMLVDKFSWVSSKRPFEEPLRDQKNNTDKRQSLPQKVLTNPVGNSTLVTTAAPTPNMGCGGCGRHHQDRVNCLYEKTKHPDYNPDGDFASSVIGKFYAKHGKSGLEAEKRREGNVLVPRDTTNDFKLKYESLITKKVSVNYVM